MSLHKAVWVTLCLLMLLILSSLCYFGTWKITIGGLADDFEILQRQATRKKHLNNFCQTHSYKIPVADDLKFILVDDRNKFMYCTIPKVGTTTWKNVFGNLRRLKENSFENIHQWDLWHRLSAYSEKGRRKRINTYFKFVFVREPFIRLISAFKDKFLGLDKWYTSREAREGITKAYRPQDFDPNGDNNVTFAEFVQYFSNNVSRNAHWREYEKLCHPCFINYDFIGHLETMQEDAPLALKLAGIDSRVTFPPIHESTYNCEVLEYFSKVPPEYITRLGEVYRRDFDMFGYDYLSHVRPLLIGNENRSSTQS